MAILLDSATDHIWCMYDGNGNIGLRVDSGESGALYFSPEQAKKVVEQFTVMLEQEAIPGARATSSDDQDEPVTIIAPEPTVMDGQTIE